MKRYILNGLDMSDESRMHDSLAECFSFPSYYGRNLDALWDMLTESSEEREIVFRNPETMPSSLFVKLAALFLDLCRAQETTLLTFDSDSLKPGKYRHFKGREYNLLHIALHSETLEPMVVYQALYGARGIWVRPASMWNETITREGREIKRFTKIED